MAKRPRSPQIDSRGIDLTVLSQLPASMRSEARIAAALRDNLSTCKSVKKADTRLGLQTWFPRVPKDSAGNENATANPTRIVGKERTSWLSFHEVDHDTLLELPLEIQVMVQAEMAQGVRENRKRAGIASFFPSTAKRYK